MCGICGIVSFREGEILDGDVLHQMCQTLAHRGPDDDGFFQDGCAFLGMRRLSIIDLVTGQQPIGNEDGTLWVVYNGEIYNYLELRQQLEARGHIFRTQSDTEVIVHAFEEYGFDFANHFNGMFAFALWDSRARRLILARDRLGIKPFYYYADGGMVVFASELKAIHAVQNVPKEIDLVALDLFLTMEYIPAPRTILSGVNKLLPGHLLVFDETGVTLKCYWDVPRAQIRDSEQECIERLVALVREAVKIRLVSDVPLGAFLSGGIDSSSVVAFMSEAMDEPVQTFSIGFEEQTYNETPYARQVAAHFGCDHHEQIIKPDIAGLVEKLVWHMDEPFGDFSIFPTYLVSKLASERVKVVLSGDGGDELFGGYDTYVAQEVDQRYYRWLPGLLRKKALPALMDTIPPQGAKKGLINKAKRFIEGGALKTTLQHTRWMMFLDPKEKAGLYTGDFAACVPDNLSENVLETYFQAAQSFDPLSQQQYVDLKTYLADDILAKVDRMSMAASIEARVPLLDYRIVEFALNLPASMKIRSSQTKRILRKAMRPYLPVEVLSKPKQGFSIPLKHWLRGELKPLMSDLLSTDTIHRRGYFKREAVSRMVKEHDQGKVNHSHRLWAMMVFELWQQVYAG